MARGFETNNPYINYEALFFEYVNETSLPKGVSLRQGGYDKIYEYLQAIFNTIVEKDIMLRFQINDKRAFGNVIRFLAGSIASPISPSGIAKALKQDQQQVHHATVEKYLQYLESSFVFYKVHRFDTKGKKQLATLEKYYLVDPGLRHVLIGRERNTDRGHLLENVVYLELLRRNYKVWTGTSRHSEVDFVCKTPTGDLVYFQVCWQLSTEETSAREFGALEQIKDHYPKYLLSTESFPEQRNGIRHLNVFQWLLGFEISE